MIKSDDDLLKIMDSLIERDFTRAEVARARKEYRKQMRERRKAQRIRYLELCKSEYPLLFTETEQN